MIGVDRNETVRFLNQYTHGGVSIVLDDTAIDFATDFANIVLHSFVAKVQQDVAAVRAAKTSVQEIPSLIAEG